MLEYKSIFFLILWPRTTYEYLNQSPILAITFRNSFIFLEWHELHDNSKSLNNFQNHCYIHLNISNIITFYPKFFLLLSSTIFFN